ncbi:MAG: sigma-54-dependent Fis family transcriptional regulator [Alphaproteobacteria bacterium]|nr:sigma-54-dependent Fis family transcriptional regulator [Alphaproteobacteria bacterium]
MGLALTVLLHPEGRRLGQRAALGALAPGAPVEISRTTPVFAGPQAPSLPLSVKSVSRRPLWLERRGDGLRLSPGDARLKVRVDGAPLSGPTTLPMQRIDGEGVFIELGASVLLWLHRAARQAPAPSWRGMIGLTPPMLALREQLVRLGPTRVPALILGESGVGKERVASALHALGPTPEGPFLAVNIAAIPKALAASTLFGHARGAFTGATQAGQGWFEQADGGTLFLDEIGDLPLAVQPQLLRAAESGEIQPVGRSARRVRVRLISATDTDLDAQVARGAFREALYHRLAGATVRVPPLRERRADVPLLLHHFLSVALAEQGFDARLADVERPWLRTGLVWSILQSPLRGNVRGLQHLAARIALHSGDAERAAAPDPLPRPEPVEDRGGGLSDARIRSVLAEHEHNITATARALGVARSTLITHIRRSDTLQLAGDLSAEAIEAARAAAGGSTEAAAEALAVSHHGLKMRMSQLGMVEG